MTEPTAANDEETQKIHVVFLHNTLKKRHEDRYLVDMAVAMKDAGHKVSIYTSEFDQSSCFSEVNSLTGCLNVFYSGWWIPRKLTTLRSILMAFRMIFCPPNPQPKIIVMDVNPIALYLLSLFSGYKTVYLSHFSNLKQLDFFTRCMKITPDLISAKALKYADDVVVQSQALADVFKRSYPNFPKDVKVVHPCYDTGLWNEDVIDICRVVPDIPKPCFLFVCFGSYKKRYNFELALNAFEDLLMISADNLKNNLHLVIAGQCSESSVEQKIYYQELLENTKYKSFANQVTFLKQVPTVHKKTLIDESIGVLIPCKHEVFPESILSVLSIGRPVIATNTGFAKEALRHRITAILVEPSPHMFAAAMYKVLTNPAVQVFLSDMGNDVFTKRYSNDVFKRKVNGIVMQHIKDKF